MLLEIYVLLSVIGFVTLFLSLAVKAGGIEEKGYGVYTNKIILSIISLLIFGFLAYSSINIERLECENQITWINTSTTNENQTSITNNIGCATEYIRGQDLSWFNMGMAIVSLILCIVFIFQTTAKTIEPFNRLR